MFFDQFASRGDGTAVHTAAVDSELISRIWDVYHNDPTIYACRRIMSGLMANATLSFFLDDKELSLSEDFRKAHSEAYLSIIDDVFDYIRVQGFVPYLIDPPAADEGLRRVNIPPPGCFNFECHLDIMHRLTISMNSVFALSEIQAVHGVFVAQNPALDGTPSSAIMPLLPELEEYRAMKSAAVEDQVKKARATLITQERRYGGGAPTTDASATALNDLNMFLGDGTGDLVSQRIDENDTSRLQQLTEQVRRARSINASTMVPSQPGQPNSDTLDTNLLALPKDQELCSSSAPPAPQDVVRHRKHLEYQITAAMGIPALLLMPGNSTYKVDDMVLRSTNTELQRLCHAASDFFTTVFRATYRQTRKRARGRPLSSGSLVRETRTIQARIEDVEVRLSPTPFMTPESVQLFSASAVFDEKYKAVLMARALGVYQRGVTEQFMRPSAPEQKAQPAAEPAAEPGQPPPVVAVKTAASEPTVGPTTKQSPPIA